MSTIKHGSFVIDLCSRNFLKIAGTAGFCQKTVFLEFLKLYFIFFHEILPTDAKWQYLKCDGGRFSKNIFFSAENAGNMPEITISADFLWTFSTYFFVFFTQKHQ